LFVGEGAGADEFDLSVIVDEDVGRVDISDFEFDSFELVGSADHVVEEVPHFSFEEELAESESVFDFVF
jgi:hypothetical protein